MIETFAVSMCLLCSAFASVYPPAYPSPPSPLSWPSPPQQSPPFIGVEKSRFRVVKTLAMSFRPVSDFCPFTAMTSVSLDLIRNEMIYSWNNVFPDFSIDERFINNSPYTSVCDSYEGTNFVTIDIPVGITFAEVVSRQSDFDDQIRLNIVGSSGGNRRKLTIVTGVVEIGITSEYTTLTDPTNPGNDGKLAIGLGIGLGVGLGTLLIAGLVTWLVLRKKKQTVHPKFTGAVDPPANVVDPPADVVDPPADAVVPPANQG
jgi:hypothetical protein